MKRIVLPMCCFFILGLFFTKNAFAEDVNLTSDGKVPGKPFEVLQLQVDNLQQQINNIQLIPGPEGPQRHPVHTEASKGSVCWEKDKDRAVPDPGGS